MDLLLLQLWIQSETGQDAIAWFLFLISTSSPGRKETCHWGTQGAEQGSAQCYWEQCGKERTPYAIEAGGRESLASKLFHHSNASQVPQSSVASGNRDASCSQLQHHITSHHICM